MGRRHGGKRKGSGRKSNMAKAAQDARRHGIRSARDFFLEAPPEVPPPPEDNILEESKREEEEETNRLRLEEERRKVEETDTEDGDADYDEEAERSREKDDIFHIFDSVPLGRKSPIRSVLMQLLIHATFEMDVETLMPVLEFLRDHKSIDTFQAAMNHFYFNREWWRQRVKMYTPKASCHAKRIHSVHHFFETNIVLKKHYTDELKDHRAWAGLRK